MHQMPAIAAEARRCVSAQRPEVERMVREALAEELRIELRSASHTPATKSVPAA
jgi:hypothetical protein